VVHFEVQTIVEGTLHQACCDLFYDKVCERKSRSCEAITHNLSKWWKYTFS